MKTAQDAHIKAALRERILAAHDASGEFDFVREGSLATFMRQATPGTTYWRGYIPMLALPGQVVALGPDSLQQAGDNFIAVKDLIGTAIWQFLGDDQRSRIALQLRRQGQRTLMEIDDNYLRFAPLLYGKHGAWQRTHDQAVENGTGYSIEMHRKVVPQMDGLIVSTDYLANVYDEHNDTIFVCRNSIDPSDWESIEREESETLRIGYYGSPSHVRDFPKVKKALKWAMRQPNVEVAMLGFSPPGWSGRTFPWEDGLFTGRANLGKIDVGIAPLTRNPWADGKSDIKAMEYAMAGVMPILEDCPSYSPWKDEAGWEWMATDEKSWVEVIHDVVRMRDEVPMLAAEAKKYVLDNRTIDHEIHAWRDAVAT